MPAESSCQTLVVVGTANPFAGATGRPPREPYGGAIGSGKGREELELADLPGEGELWLDRETGLALRLEMTQEIDLRMDMKIVGPEEDQTVSMRMRGTTPVVGEVLGESDPGGEGRGDAALT